MARLRRLWSTQTQTLEEIRKRARLLVIDDHQFPFQKLFERDGYSIDRWNKIENISQLTDNGFDVILLDLHGVGLRESPHLQGLGVLEHVKARSPLQLVVAYSAQDWSPGYSEFFGLADAVLAKDSPYLDFKEKVDSLLVSRYSPGFYIERMNSILADQAAQVPKAVKYANKALKSGSSDSFRDYLAGRVLDEVTIDRVLQVIGIGIAIFK